MLITLMTKLMNRLLKVGDYIDSVIFASNILQSLINCTCFFLDSLKRKRTQVINEQWHVISNKVAFWQV